MQVKFHDLRNGHPLALKKIKFKREILSEYQIQSIEKNATYLRFLNLEISNLFYLLFCQ